MRTKFSGMLTLLLAFVVQLTFAQEKTISGTVTDDSGLPLPGVNVLVKNTNTGTQTDFDGNYTITANQGQTLVFSYQGFKKQEVSVGANSTVNVSLVTDVAELNEVVVTALGIKRKPDEITTANQVVKAEELVQAQNPNVAQGLVGKVSGLNITTSGSGVNNDVRINFRGNRSLTGSNEALIVIDGVISSKEIFTTLDPNLVESINAIKGPNGAALYGSQGSNGVLIVTTKTGGTTDKFLVQVNSSVTIDDVAFLPQRQTRYGQGWNGITVSYENGGWGPEMDGSLIPVGLPREDGTYRYFEYSPIDDNIGQFFQNGTTFQNTVSLSTGNMDTGYVFLSANKSEREFIIEDDIFDRSTFNVKGGKKIGNWSLQGNVTYITDKTEQSTGSIYTDLLQTATNIPVEEFDDPNNATHWTSYYRSPYWIRDNERSTDRTNVITGIANVGYQINDNIDVVYNANIRTRSASGFDYVNGDVDLLNVGGGDYTTQSSFDTYANSLRSYYGDLIVNFDYMLTDDISFGANVGHNLQDRLFEQTQAGGDNLTIPGFYNVDNVTGTPRVANTRTRERRTALFANVDFGYKDWIYLNATARNDWTSVLDDSVNSYFYPSVGVSWIPTKMFDFGGDVLSRLKLAASIVRVGNDGGIDPYDVNPTLNQAFGYPYGNLNSFGNNTNIVDPLLEPEFITSREFNLVAEFLNRRITLDASYFFSDNTNQISRSSTSLASGVQFATINIGETETKGFEVDLGVRPIWSDDPSGFRWNARVFYSTNVTDVIKISDDATELAIQSFPNNANPVGVFAIEGEEFPIIKGTAYLRDPDGRVLIDPTTGTPRVSSDLQILGNSNPDYILGLNTSVSFKGFTLAGVFDYRTGHQYWSGSKSWLSWSGHLIESAVNGRSGFVYPNSAIETSPGVFEANTGVLTGGTTYSNFLNYFSNDFYTVTENFVIDATAFKVRELALSYTVPSKFLDNTLFSRVSLSAIARNPFIVLPKENRGYNDPETSNTTGNGLGLANINRYPTTKSYGLNVNVSF